MSSTEGFCLHIKKQSTFACAFTRAATYFSLGSYYNDVADQAVVLVHIERAFGMPYDELKGFTMDGIGFLYRRLGLPSISRQGWMFS